MTTILVYKAKKLFLRYGYFLLRYDEKSVPPLNNHDDIFTTLKEFRKTTFVYISMIKN